MSDQTPAGPPEGSDPFDDLLAGLASERTPAASPELTPTVAMPASELPGGSLAAEPPAAPPLPGEPVAPTLVLPGTQLDPTAATTAISGGSGEPPTDPPTSGGGFSSWDPRRKALVITLIVVGGVLLIALVILLVVILTSKGPGPGPTPSPTVTPSPTASPTPTPTPTPSPTASPTPPPVANATITSFTGPNTAQCANSNSGTVAQVPLNWATANATTIALAWGPSQTDAITNPKQSGLPAQATNSATTFDCSVASLTYSLTVSSANNVHSTQVITVARQITPPPPPVAAPVLTAPTWTDGTDYVICPSFDAGDSVTKDVSWTSTPSVNAVEVWLATDPSAYPGPSGTFVQVGSGLPASGSFSVPIDCGTSGFSSYFTVRVVAKNVSGTTDAFLNGNTAS